MGTPYDINIFAVWDSPGGSGVISAPQTSPWDSRAWGGSYSGNNLPALKNSERLWWPGSSAQPHATTFHVCAWTGNDTSSEILTIDRQMRVNLTLTVKRSGQVVKTMSLVHSGIDIALQMTQLEQHAPGDQCGPETAAYVGSYSYRPTNKRPADGAPWLELQLSWEAGPKNGQVRLAKTVRGADGQAYEVALDPGRLLVYRDGAWGSVCIEGFPNPALVCRQLGYVGTLGEAFTYGADAASPITVTDRSLTVVADELEASADVGVTFVGVPHLRLVDSVVRGLQLSTGGPLVQCLDCAFLTMDNVTVQDLRGYPLTESRPVNVCCQSVREANGWGCVLLRLSEALGSYPVRIANSTFTEVDVHWAGAYGTFSDANKEGNPVENDIYPALPMGYGAVVVDAGRPGVAAVIEVSDSAFVSVAGGLGYGLALINNAMLSLDSITLNRVSFDQCRGSLYGSYDIYVQGSVHSFVATRSSFTNGYEGVLGVTRHAEIIRMSDCVLADNACASEPALFHLGSLSALELHHCNVSRNGGCGAATILVERQLAFVFRRSPEAMRGIIITNSTLVGNLGTFFASDLYVSGITLQDSVLENNTGVTAGVFDLSKPSSGVSSVDISGCRIAGNSAGSYSWDLGVDGNGGFMSTSVLSSLTLKGSSVEGNSAPVSGGVLSIDNPRQTSHVTIEDSTVRGNSASASGGVLATRGFVDVTLLGASTVVNHSAASGAVLYGAGAVNSFEVSSKSVVADNVASRQGGVIMTSALVTAVIDGKVENNSARQGAALFVSGDLGSLAVSGALKRNAAATAFGGSMWVGGELGGLSFVTGSTVDGTVTSAEGVADLADVAASGAAAGLRECTSVCHTRPPMPPSPPVYGGHDMPPSYGGDMPPAYGDDSMPPPMAPEQEGAPSIKSRRMRVY
ncbi:hypothetical protein HYH03_012966 [Edaphochlamys debaryana]|uniref:SRCR domain-containing protein n=1 Tax=Edaphochlamys debaryana TaxID=47281 RepID=A0A835XRQ5_9CHLO|nr:hypothetical protein HYH03_012966 [Edaphochlamys debaryana]|eukprot:KAG2488460.1 hypothetical protein HYH03_012966 [Edaphochlamys debaryana]